MDYSKELSEIFSTESDEYKTLVEINRVLSMSSPSISSEAKSQMIILDSSKTKLSTIYFMLNRAISRLKREVQSAYDIQYTRLVKLGRPSNTAIEAEIRSTNPQYVTNSQRISDLEDIKDLIYNYMKCIDSCKFTASEILRDSRRID